MYSLLVYCACSLPMYFFGGSTGAVNNELKICVITHHKEWGITFYILDIILSIDCLYLFLRPLRNHIKISKHLSDKDCTHKQIGIDNLYKLMIKFALLASICILSSLMFYPFILYVGAYGSYFGLFDNLTNSVCILLTQAKYHNIYIY